MLIRRLIPLTCVLVLGCDPSPEPVGEAEASGGASDSMTSSDSTTDDSQSGTTGSASDSISSGPPTSTTAVTSMGTSGSSGFDDLPLDVGGGTGTDTSSIPGDCALEPLVCEMVEGAKVPPDQVVDCGSVALGDAKDDYGELRNCILAASEEQQAYKGFVQLQGIDSEVWAAWGSIVGFAYTEHRWFYDNYQGNEMVSMSTCTPVPTEDPDCAPGPQGLCLDCAEEGEKPPAVVCSSE